MSRVCFDYGHGGRDSGATYKSRKESDDVLLLGQEVATYLRNHGVIVHETRTSNRSLGLWERVRFENKNTYDYFISFHRNAFKPELANGAETYVYLQSGVKAYNLAIDIQKALEEIGFRNRGVKRGNFYVLRGTRAPALLLEIGFIDQTKDNELFDNKKEEIVRVLGEMILAHLG